MPEALNEKFYFEKTKLKKKSSTLRLVYAFKKYLQSNQDEQGPGEIGRVGFCHCIEESSYLPLRGQGVG